MVGRHVGALLPLIRTPSGLSGALFTSRGTYTLPFIWARPLTSTEKGFFFFQGMSGSKLLDALSGHADERETRQNAPPPPAPFPLLSTGQPQAPVSPPPPSQLPLPPGRQGTPPYPLAGGPGTGATQSSGSHPLPPTPPTPILWRVPGFRGAGLHETKYCEAPLRVS